MLLDWLRHHQTKVVPAALLFISLALLSHGAYSSRNSQMNLFAKTVLSTVGYAQATVNLITDGVTGTWQRYVWLTGVEEENRRLKKENRRLIRKLSELQEVAKENDRLRRLSRFQPKQTIKDWIAARVIGKSMVGFNKTISIDRGSRDGIKPRMAVITYEGAIVGQILGEPGSGIGFHSSQVLLITDRRSRLDVMSQRSRDTGILAGRPEVDMCELLYTEQADLKEGDLLISSGLGKVFRKGWPAGHVVDIKKDPAGFSPRIKVRPQADFSKLEEVLVILSSESRP
ncbi:MAG: rod shape-determining protein MreC [bacterium]